MEKIPQEMHSPLKTKYFNISKNISNKSGPNGFKYIQSNGDRCLLTVSQMKNFRLFQTERVCR